MFHDEVAYEADLGVGISLGDLVPFRYFGLADTTDYAPIPWRASKRFGLEELSAAVQTQARMKVLWEALQAHPGTRTLFFCCTIGHARFVCDWLAEAGLRVAAVHSGKGSSDRATSLDALAAGKLDGICTVDLLNEGVDLPLVDRVVMLRPTESSVVFLQQLGRGLRVAEGKTELVVIDFIGNHVVFLDRVRLLLNLADDGRQHDIAELQAGPVALPGGCSVAVELAAVALLTRLLPSGQGHVLVRTYRSIRAAWQRRPLAGELSRMGLNPGAAFLRRAHDHWLGFVRSEGDLNPDEARVLGCHEAWFRELGRTNLTKSFKMVTLQALIEAGALTRGMALEELAARSHGILKRSPELHADIRGVRALPRPMDPDPSAWARYWRDNPIAAWSGGPFFLVTDGVLRLRAEVAAEDADTFAALTAELVDWRLHAYRRRRAREAPGGDGAFLCKLITNKRDPILKLPDRSVFPGLPTGEVDVRLVDGTWWRFRFVKHFVNVARPVGRQVNELPDLLRGWFGLAAGRPGTDHLVRFAMTTEGWMVEPTQASSRVSYPSFGRVTAYPDLRIAAGFHPERQGQAELLEQVVHLPGREGADLWTARASGSSMDGGREPIRDGDWMVFRWRRSAGVSEVDGRVACVERGEDGDTTLHVKRIVRRDGRVWLRSDNPLMDDEPARPGDRVLAVLQRVVRPEHLGPERFSQGRLDQLFPWAEDSGQAGVVRIGGHLFLLLAEAGQAASPCLVQARSPRVSAAETAFVCHEVSGRWRYLGVGRSRDGSQWTVPEMDFQAWSLLRPDGVRGGLSRELSAHARAAAEAFADRFAAGDRVVHDGKSLTVVGRTSGGLQIEDPGRLAPRTVTITDIGWVLHARDELAGGVLDEAAVNVLRYLEGVPKRSTRWIDTGHALHLVLGAPADSQGPSGQ